MLVGRQIFVTMGRGSEETCRGSGGNVGNNLPTEQCGFYEIVFALRGLQAAPGDARRKAWVISVMAPG